MTQLIYCIGSDSFWTGESVSIEDTDPMPKDWTNKTPPQMNEGEQAAWGLDDWVLTKVKPQTVAPEFTLSEEEKRTLYTKYADPIFFKWQRGEAEKEDWLAAIEAVKAGELT